MSKMKNFKGNPFRGFGVFLIVLGLMMLAATTDFLGWGDIDEYIRWEMLLVFLGLIMLLSGNFTASVVMLSIGAWFLLPDLMPVVPEYVRVGFWPAVLVLAGITYIIPSPKRWCRDRNIN
jgi:low temperature requirement protein LtrA